MSARKKKDKRKQKNRERQARLQRLQAPFGGAKVVIAPPGQVKMSEVILEFIDPYAQGRSDDQIAKLISVAIVAWNAALLTASEREAFIQKMVAAVPPEARSDMRTVVEELIRRKETHFASNTRMIVNYDLSMTPEGPHLSVMSTLGSE